MKKLFEKARDLNRQEHGNAILEFAIILPMLFLLVLGTVEFSQLFRVKEFQTLVTREASSIAYRECFERGQRNCVTEELLGMIGQQAQTRLETCLDEWRRQIDIEISNVLDGVDLTIGFHEFQPAAGGGGRIVTIGATTKASSNVTPTDSRYVRDPVAIDRDFGDMIRESGLIVTAESFVDFPFSGLNIFAPNIRLYHVTVH